MTKKHDIIWLDSTDSTNNEAKRRLADIDNLSVLSASRQTAGRGQRGNTWLSEDGSNLLFSIVLKHPHLPRIKAYDQFVLSQAASLSIVDFLSCHGVTAKVKWPNDIYVGEKKICGILVENSLHGEWISSSIIGIGLNINQRNFDVSLPDATSLVRETEEISDLKSCLEEIMDIFCGYISRYCHIKGGYARLRRLYLAQLWKFEEESSYMDYTAGNHSGRMFRGTITGISDVGNLLIKENEGKLREFAFKEIGFISSQQ